MTSPTHEPWSIDLEQAIIGMLLREPALAEPAAAEISPDDFYDPLHARMFGVATSLGIKASPIALWEAMRTDPGLVECGGMDYLNAMRTAAPVSHGVKHYCALLKDLATRRGLAQVGQALLDGAYSPPEENPSQRLTDEATGRLLGLASTYGAERTQALSAVARGRLDMAEKRLAGGEIRSIPTGLSRLDKAIGGLQPGDHMLLAGRSGAGKSGLAASMGHAAARAGAPVLIICADMTKERWAERVMCDVAFQADPASPPIHYGWFRGRLSESQLDRLAVAQNDMAAWPCDICDEGQITTARIRAKVRAMANRYPGQQGLLITDFLQKLPPPSARKDERRDEGLTANTYEIGDIVKDVGWSALTLAQLKNKDTDGRGKLREDVPNETDVRESGGILQAVDIAMAIHRKAYFVERREPAGRDYHPTPPADWLEWDAELNACKDEAQLIGFKNRDSSVTALHMTLWCQMATNTFADEKPGRYFASPQDVAEMQF